METPRSSDTIDLSQAIVRLIRLLNDNFLSILLAVVISLAIGGFYYWFMPRTYESKMIIQSDILSESYSLKMAESLNEHIRDSDIDYLANKLSLTNDEAMLLREFKIASALSPMSQQMAEKEKIIVVITVRVQDNNVLPKLQVGVIQYFSNNEYIKKRVDENRKKFEGLVAALDREIKMMDTLKQKISNGTFATAKAGGISVVDFAALYGVAASLHEKRYDFMIDLATVDSIQVIEGFTPYGKAVWPKLSIILLVSLMMAAVFVFVIITYKTFKNQITN